VLASQGELLHGVMSSADLWISGLGYFLEERKSLQNSDSFFLFCFVLVRSGQQIRNTWKVLKCGAGEGWRSVGPMV
jgi:hypothetical protein